MKLSERGREGERERGREGEKIVEKIFCQQFSLHFSSPFASREIQSLDLRFMSQKLYHCATEVQIIYI
jgi:hypothetical protein